MANLDQDFYIELGYILKDARLKKKYSYDTLSDKINNIKTKSTLKRYEAGESRIEIGILEAICDALDLDVDSTLKTARNRAVHGRSVHKEKESALSECFIMEHMLAENGYTIGFDEEDAFMWINYPDGTLEITEEMLKALFRDINVYIKFKMEDLKQSHLEDFKKK